MPVWPSPKSQSRLVMSPEDWSVNRTVSGAFPEVGVPEKFATGVEEAETVM